MDNFRFLGKCRTRAAVVMCLCVVGSVASGAWLLWAQSASGAADASGESALIAEFRRVEVASVSDALEQLAGKRMYMSHRMHPIFTAKFAGFARTVQLKKDEGTNDPAALSGMLEAIDAGS